MIKMIVEFVRSAPTNEDRPALRLIIFNAEEIPELQDSPFWTVSDIVQFGIDQVEALEGWIGEYLAKNACLELALRPEFGASVVIDTSSGSPSWPSLSPILRAVHEEWVDKLDSIAPDEEKSDMKKFTVVLWEQRRIEMQIEATDESAAEDAARKAWHFLGDNNLDTSACSEVKFVDNREIKSIIIEGGKPMSDIISHPMRYPTHDDEKKGQVHGGVCNVTRCDNSNAVFWNAMTYGFYCVTCARDINWRGTLCRVVDKKPTLEEMETIYRETSKRCFG